MTKTHIILDLDDTLVNIWDDYFKDIAIKAYQELGYTVTKQDFDRERIYQVLRHLRDDDYWKVHDKHDTAKSREEAIRQGRIFLMKGVHSALEKLAKLGDIYIVSNTPEHLAKVEMDKFNLNKYPKAVSFMTHGKPNKPNPARALELLAGRFEPGHRLYVIGDSEEDVLLGRALGAKTLFYDWRSQTRAEPDVRVKSLEEAADVIKDLM